VLRTASEARDRAQLVLGAISLVVWLVVAFALGVVWYVDEDTPQPILMAGGIALLVAALPWLAYRPLVRRLSRGLTDTPSSRGADPRL
jgi:membrane protein YdbS with pleckstrin-like domain